jgi:methylthioxylose transferase
MAIPAFAVILRRRSAKALIAGLLGAGAVAAAFTAAGFDWLTGYHLVQQRYYQGLAAHRPYLYWVWADLALLVVSAGPAAAAALPRTVQTAAVGAVVAIVAADLSGFSKAEVERIWLPFAVWLLAATGSLPARDRRGWLLAQAAVALLVNHLLLTTW